VKLLARRLAVAALVAASTPALAQDRAAGDGVYTSAQAMRGATAFQQSCSTCHREDGTAPALAGERFARFWTDANLNTLFTQIKTAMPRNAPASLTEAVYTDIVAHLLATNGFPPGGDDLRPAAMDGIRIGVSGATAGSIPDFTLVQVVGCLERDATGKWALVAATDPARTREPDAPKDLAAFDASPSGTRTFRLLQLYTAPKGWSGQRVVAKGFLLRSGAEERLTITSIGSLTSSCSR